MKITATNQETTSAIATTQKMPPAYSATAEAAKPTGMKPAAVTSVPVSIGKAVMSQAAAAALIRSQPCSIFTTIISMAMIASSTSSPSAMISAPERDAVEVDPHHRHHQEDDGEHQRHRERDDDAGAEARAR